MKALVRGEAVEPVSYTHGRIALRPHPQAHVDAPAHETAQSRQPSRRPATRPLPHPRVACGSPRAGRHALGKPREA